MTDRKQPRQKKATALEVKAMREPGRHSIGDGLILSVGTSGSRSWIARVRDQQGRRRDIGLGPYPEVSLEEARARSVELRRQVRDGIDPVAQKRALARRVPSFREAAAQAHSERKGSWRNPKHQTQWLATLEQFAFAKLGDVPVDKIDASLIIRTLLPIWLRIPETSRRVRQRILAVLNWSHAHGFRESEAPARSVTAGLPRQPKKSGRFAAMAYTDVPSFFAALAQAPVTIGRLALQFTILTAARSGEVRGATWKEFDLQRELWTIPGNRMKAGEEHVVPLSAPALAIARHLSEFCSSNSVFPGLRGKPLSDATLSKILREMQVPVTVHGFRSSFRDWAAETSTMPGEVAEAALAHTVTNRVEAAYRRTKYLEHRKVLMAAWANFVTGAPLDQEAKQ